jgi:STE24 endopeptidase
LVTDHLVFQEQFGYTLQTTKQTPCEDDVDMASQGVVAATARPSFDTPGQGSVDHPLKAKTYNRIKLSAAITSSVVSFGVILALVATGVTRTLEWWARSTVPNLYGALLLFALALGIVQMLVSLPIGFYSSYSIEHRYRLSNQSLRQWAWERLKGALVSLPLVAGVLVVLYYCLEHYGGWWWLPVSGVLILLSVLLARLAPVLIFPLFYKFTPLESESLTNRIVRLCANTGLRIEGIFSFNLSKNTKKANAGFTGIGRSKRIILSDTLIKDFTEEEIETVFAHELGHYRHKHLLIGIVTGIVSTVAGLFFTALLYEWSLGLFSFSDGSGLAALPLLALWLSLFGAVTAPLGNMLSRHHERVADAYAVNVTGKSAAFASALHKLAAINVADPNPHPLVEFLFYSHPSISKRIRRVESLGA